MFRGKASIDEMFEMAESAGIKLKLVDIPASVEAIAGALGPRVEAAVAGGASFAAVEIGGSQGDGFLFLIRPKISTAKSA